jgi:hypothetical protein
VERLTDLDTAVHENLAGRLDVVDDQLEPLKRAGRRGGQPVAERDGAVRVRGRDWIAARTSPTLKSASSRHPSLVEPPGPVHIGDRQRHDLKPGAAADRSRPWKHF